MVKKSYVYILASKHQGVLYIGVTSDLVKRVFQHKNGLADGFTKKYFVHKLVCYEEFGSINEAILREKQMKKWKREWKVKLIEKENPLWKDLYSQIV